MRILNSIKDVLTIKKFNTEFDETIHKTIVNFDELSTRRYWDIELQSCPTFKEVEQWNDGKKVDFIVHCVNRIRGYNHGNNPFFNTNSYSKPTRVMKKYLGVFLRRKIEMNETNFEKLTDLVTEEIEQDYYYKKVQLISYTINQIQKQYKDKPLSDKLIEDLNDIRHYLEHNRSFYITEKKRVKLIDKIDDLLSPPNKNGAIKQVLFTGNDEFSPHANGTISRMEDEQQKIWYQLIEKAKKASGSKPSKKYLSDTKTLIKELGINRFKKVVSDWFNFVMNMQGEIQIRKFYYGRNESYDRHVFIFLDALNNETLKGFVWMCAHFHDTTTLQNIANLGERCHRKVSGVGSPAAAVGNACFYTLYKSKGLDGIGKLSTLKTKIKRKQALKLIDKYLTQAAKDKGISIHEIQDLSIDDYGLIEGKRIYTFDDYTATISIIKPGKSSLTWLKPDGKTQKSIPAFVKTKHAAKLKKMKNTKKQIDQTTSAQRNRIDRMFKADRTWNVEHFEKLFLKHGLMCTLTKKLIWTFTHNDESQSAIYLNDQWINHKKEPVTLHSKATITLWHPALCSLDEVQGWRSFLMENEIQQLLKQAFREIYLLTEAEINTRTYSNRMAAHIIKQHQYLSLVKARNWSASITGGWDSGDGTARLDIPEYGLRAEFWAEGMRDDNAIFDYLSTDQIRFTDAATNEVVELVNIPPIVFSEVLRDVDLFVGVASVGNDPMWQDTGNRPGFRDYWHSYSFGDLSAIAKNRKEILENLVPRLKIKDVAEVTDKYVIVKGKLRTYKIHIGSSNIMMEPNDQYLCIVPDRSKKDFTSNLFIPFEGDKTLSVILSKAFLLANDDKITDSSITSQINRK